MREAFEAGLEELNQLLVSMAEAARTAMQNATTALLNADRNAAETVIAEDDRIDTLKQEVDNRAYELLARQAPVAGDLRRITTALHVGADLERMGDLAQHVAKIALMRHPSAAVPPELATVFLQMSTAADHMAKKITSVLATHDTKRAAELEKEDDDMDALHREMFTVLFGNWPHDVESAVDAALLGRFYERYADHAVNAARRVIYLVTGENPTPPAS